MDVLITRQDNGQIDGILPTLVERLMERKLIVEILSSSNKVKDENVNVFMGICVWKSGINRRIDIKVYNKQEYPFAVMYFTGSRYFNRSLRLFAKKIGFHLSDKELINFRKGKRVYCKNEEEIFKVLGISYKTPKQRDI